MKRLLTTLIAPLLIWGPLQGTGEKDAGAILRFIHRQGEKYRILTEVNEDVYINGAHSHASNILNKVAVDTLEAKDGAGHLACGFRMSESIRGRFNTFYLREDYESRFWRDAQGVFTIDPKYYMPVIRNVPRFPAGPVKPGDSWSGDAEEVHDLRRGYGIEKPFKFPVKVSYNYLRDEMKDGVPTAVLKVEYTTFHRVAYDRAPARPVPVKITGRSEQTYWWDPAAGMLHSYHEEFDYIFFLSNGGHVEYRGTADGVLLKSPVLDRDRVAVELEKNIKEKRIGDTAVRKDENGVTIVLENIQFPPNSPELTAPERGKMTRIAEILKRFPDRDFQITGHTARVGDEKTSQTLSEQRAMAVCDFLISRGAFKKTRAVTRGMGSREPAADNATEEGRKRNRRVEITILEN
ncbi:MAG: OmpA family protein [Spirochaetes bacterium]|nr:OmpA family protein [Spirochaetota bacterium]